MRVPKESQVFDSWPVLWHHRYNLDLEGQHISEMPTSFDKEVFVVVPTGIVVAVGGTNGLETLSSSTPL